MDNIFEDKDYLFLKKRINPSDLQLLIDVISKAQNIIISETKKSLEEVKNG